MSLKFASPWRSWPISMVGWCCLVLVYLQLVRATDVSFTIEVAAGSRDCFHQPLKKDVQYESEYQVIMAEHSSNSTLHEYDANYSSVRLRKFGGILKLRENNHEYILRHLLVSICISSVLH